MAKEQKTNLYLLSIVAIVAIVGIVVLILNSGTGSVSLSSDDLSGEALKVGSTFTLSTSGSSGPSFTLNAGACSACGNNCICCPCTDPDTGKAATCKTCGQ